MAALFPCVLKVSDLIVRAHYNDFSAVFLQLPHIAIAEFRAPPKTFGIITFYIIKGPERVKPAHVLAKFMDVALNDNAGGWLILASSRRGGAKFLGMISEVSKQALFFLLAAFAALLQCSAVGKKRRQMS